MERTVLRGARWPGDVALVDGVITAVGTVASSEHDAEILCTGDVVTPGLVNTHHHLSQGLTRGWALDCGLFEWLQHLYPAWSRASPEDVYAAAIVGLCELVRTGCTTTADHHYVLPDGDETVFDALIAAARLVGVRLHLGRGFAEFGESDGGIVPDSLVEDGNAVLTSIARLVDSYHDGERISVAVAPASPLAVSREFLRESGEFARAKGLRLHTHLAETMEERGVSLQLFGQSTVELLDAEGWLGSDAWFAHGTHLSGGDITRLAETGTSIAHCPTSNARLAAGICRVTDLLDAGVGVGLGVDGAASNENGGILPELRQALLLARLRTGRANALMPQDVLDMGTQGGADCLGRNDLGALAVGRKADIVVWPGDDLADMADPVAGLVLGPTRHARHVFVGGRQILQDGEVTGTDLHAARNELARRARRLWPEMSTDTPRPLQD